MRASITCGGRGIRKMFRSRLAELGPVLLVAAVLGACREPELRIVSSSLALLNVSVYWQDIIRGSILLAAVSFDLYLHKRKTT